MLAPLDTLLLTIFVKAVSVEQGVELWTLVGAAHARGKHLRLELPLSETASKPVRQAVVTDCNPVTSGDNPFQREPTLEIFIPHRSDTLSINL